MSDADRLLDELDRRYSSVDIYRTADKSWRVRIITSGSDRVAAGETLAAALEAAVAMRPPLPRFRRQPRADDTHVIKLGSVWSVEFGGGGRYGRYRTKTEAEASAATMRQRQADAFAAWQSEVGPLVADGGHGVRWLWLDDPQEMG